MRAAPPRAAEAGAPLRVDPPLVSWSAATSLEGTGPSPVVQGRLCARWPNVTESLASSTYRAADEPRGQRCSSIVIV